VSRIVLAKMIGRIARGLASSASNASMRSVAVGNGAYGTIAVRNGIFQCSSTSSCGFRLFSSGSTLMKSVEDEEPTPIEDVAMSIDTTLTPEEQARADMWKKKIKGGNPKVRSFYRDVPTTDEIDALKIPGNFLPKIAPNAEALIDFALAQLPIRDGYRGTRKAKRMNNKWSDVRKQDAKMKAQTLAAREKKHQKLKVQRAKIAVYKQQAKELYPHLYIGEDEEKGVGKAARRLKKNKNNAAGRSQGEE